MNAKFKGIKHVFLAAAMAVLTAVLPVQQVHAQVVVVDPTPAIEVFRNQQWLVYLEQAADKLKEYKQQILDYKEQVSQGITQAKQLKQLYDNAKTFALDDMPHFVSDLKRNPIQALADYSSALDDMAQDADKAMDTLVNSKIKLGSGLSYSVSDLAGLSADDWSGAVSLASNDTKLSEDAKKWAEKLDPKDIVMIRKKYCMSPEDYYKNNIMKRSWSKQIASVLGTSSRFLNQVNQRAKAYRGYIKDIQQMATNNGISESEIEQLAVQGSALSAQGINDICTMMQTALGTTMQGQSAQRELEQAKRNQEYAEQKAWEEELARDDVPDFYYSDGSGWFPDVPSNRSTPIPAFLRD